MKEIFYEIKTANDNWIRRVYLANDEKDYEMIIKFIESNKDYRIISKGC